MFNAISYGFLTLLILWAGGGALSGALVGNSLILLVLMTATLVGLTKSSKIELVKKPYKLFSSSMDQYKGLAILALTLITLISVKSFMPESFASQAHAFSKSSLGLSVFFIGALVVSDLIFRHLYSPEWGPASTAFLEALAWGLSTQSFVFFLWLFVSGFLLSKFTKVNGYAGSALLRLVLGVLWLSLV